MMKVLLSAAAVFGAFTLSACSVNVTVNDPGATKDGTTEAEVTQEDIEKLIIGKWMTAERDGQPVPTNEKGVHDIISITKGYTSASIDTFMGTTSVWHTDTEETVSISDNQLNLTFNPDEHTVFELEFAITSINNNEFTADRKLTITVDGNVKYSDDKTAVRFVKVDADFTGDIIGTWEGRCTSDGSVFDDGQDHRWEYKSDGTFVYYVKNGDEWVPSEDTMNEYFVDGKLLCTRWMEGDEENREWWEISIDGDKMNWTALREDEDGNTFTAEFEMTKVGNEDLNVAEQIIGKWMTAERDGQPALTNEKNVYDIVSTTEAYVSLSRTKGNSPWKNNIKKSVEINGNVVTIAAPPGENSSVVNEFTIIEISAEEFTAKHKNTRTVEGSEPVVTERVDTFVRVNEDYSNDILGSWEGHCTSEGSVFDDGQDHRWEYKSDGTFVYYVKDGDDWIPSEDTMNEYFVAGNLLFTRWMEGDEENREWWEISIDGDKMNWTALREDEDGNTFTATFELSKVEK